MNINAHFDPLSTLTCNASTITIFHICYQGYDFRKVRVGLFVLRDSIVRSVRRDARPLGASAAAARHARRRVSLHDATGFFPDEQRKPRPRPQPLPRRPAARGKGPGERTGGLLF